MLSGSSLALLFWWHSLTPTLIPRSWQMQAAIGAVCLAIGYGIGTLAGRWGQRYPPIVASWRRNWERVIPFLAYPIEVDQCRSRMESGIESIRYPLRRAIRCRWDVRPVLTDLTHRISDRSFAPRV